MPSTPFSNIRLLQIYESVWTATHRTPMNIWKKLILKYCAKASFHGLTVVQTVIAIVVCIHNYGASNLKRILEHMNISAGTCMQTFKEGKDTHSTDVLSTRSRWYLKSKGDWGSMVGRKNWHRWWEFLMYQSGGGY